jgi:hypothetical protein
LPLRWLPLRWFQAGASDLAERAPLAPLAACAAGLPFPLVRLLLAEAVPACRTGWLPVDDCAGLRSRE